MRRNRKKPGLYRPFPLPVVRDPGVMEAGQTDWCSSIITGQPRHLYSEFLYRAVMDHTVARTVLVTCRYVPQ